MRGLNPTAGKQALTRLLRNALIYLMFIYTMKPDVVKWKDSGRHIEEDVKPSDGLRYDT
jgi:hypothetical protein